MSTKTNAAKPKTRKISAAKLATTAILGAIGTMLMTIQIGLPIMPAHIKLDLSELPALLASFSMGPVYGVAVCLIKNLFHLPISSTFCVGELSNFILGCCLVIPAGIIYRKKKTRKRALTGAMTGSLLMALAAIPLNIVLILYVYKFFMPVEAIIGLYKAILPSVDSLFVFVTVFNFPFTLVKGILTSFLTFLIYKPLSPLLHK